MSCFNVFVKGHVPAKRCWSGLEVAQTRSFLLPQTVPEPEYSANAKYRVLVSFNKTEVSDKTMELTLIFVAELHPNVKP